MTPEQFIASPDLQEKFFDAWIKRMKEIGVKKPDSFLALWHKGWGDISTKRINELKKDPEVQKYLNTKP